MHVLMLGWEFPPFIAGGLGTACHGLTKALDRRDVDVTFVLPKVIDRSHSSHVNLVSPTAPTVAAIAAAAQPAGSTFVPSATRGAPQGSSAVTESDGGAAVKVPFAHLRFIGVPAGFNNPYQRHA